MTQKNIDVMDIIVNKMVEGDKLSKALQRVYDKRNVVMPQNEKLHGIKIIDLDMSTRTKNALMRNRLTTIGEVIKYANKNGVKNLKGFGFNSGIELFEAILDLHWGYMTKEERVNFLIDTVERNQDNIRPEFM